MFALRLVIDGRALVRHKVTSLGGAEKAFPDRHSGFAIVAAEYGLDGCCCILQVVMRNAQEDVVGHMGPDVMVNRVEDAVIAIDGGQCAF